MQTVTFAHAFHDALQAVKATEILAILKTHMSEPALPISDGQKEAITPLIFAIQRSVRQLEGSEAGEVLGLLGLREMWTDVTLGELLTRYHQAPHGNALLNDRRFIYLYYFLEVSVRMSAGVQSLLVESKTAPAIKENSVLPLEIAVDEGTRLPVATMSTIISSLDDLFQEVSDYTEGERTLLKIAYLDSGSRITIGLEGLAKVIAEVRKLFADAWNTFRYQENIDLERDWATISNGITLVSEVRAKGASGEMDGETARRIEHVVNTKMQGLLGVGVMIPDAEQPDFDKDRLLRQIRNPRLLSGGDTDRSGTEERQADQALDDAEGE